MISLPNRTTALLLAQRVWQGFGGLVTLIIVADTLTLDQQGWYYSFLGVAALYTLFDLGLSTVLVQNAAYYASTARWTDDGRLQGDGAPRLAALMAFATRHYLWLAAAFVLLLLPAGLWFFSSHGHPQPAWHSAWAALVTATAAALVALPLLAIVEGSGQVAAVAGVRLTQAMLGSLLTWIVLVAGGTLWASAAMPLMAALCSTIWLLWRRPGVPAAIVTADHTLIAWRTEIFPLQWRLGLSLLSGFILTQVHTLVLFAYVGAGAAGQMGLSLTIGNMIGLVSQSFIARHIPAMARAAAERNWRKLDALFRRDFMLSCGTYLLGAGAVVALALALQSNAYGQRLLPPLPFTLLLLALFLGHMQTMLAAQLRSYRREPLLRVSLFGAVIMGLGVLPAATQAGATGIVILMLVVQASVVIPASVLIFLKFNRQWRTS